MTERDKYERNVGRQWEDVLNWARAQVSVDEVAEEAIPCLVKTLNQNGVIPGLKGVFEIVESPVAAAGQFAALDRLADTHGHKHTAVATNQAKRMCLEQTRFPGRHGLVPSREVLCHRILNALMETYCFATTRVAMQVEGRFGSPREADEWRSELRTACDERLGSLVRLLSHDPSLARLPVPKCSRKKRPIADLIHEPLVVPNDQSLRESQHHESQ